MLGSVSIVLALVSLCSSTDNCPNEKSDWCADVAGSSGQSFDTDVDWPNATSIYQFSANDINGTRVSLEKYRGHVLIVVNVASQCGLTDTNYKQLEELYERYGESKGLKILAFPSDQFGGQEPGTSEQIFNFAKRYNVKFDMFEKVDVNGDNAHPLWKWLKRRAGGFITDDIKWNFSKFIVDKNGQVAQRFAPTTEPLTLENTLKTYF